MITVVSTQTGKIYDEFECVFFLVVCKLAFQKLINSEVRMKKMFTNTCEEVL